MKINILLVMSKLPKKLWQNDFVVESEIYLQKQPFPTLQKLEVVMIVVLVELRREIITKCVTAKSRICMYKNVHEGRIYRDNMESTMIILFNSSHNWKY